MEEAIDEGFACVLEVIGLGVGRRGEGEVAEVDVEQVCQLDPRDEEGE